MLKIKNETYKIILFNEFIGFKNIIVKLYLIDFNENKNKTDEKMSMFVSFEIEKKMHKKYNFRKKLKIKIIKIPMMLKIYPRR